MEPFGGDTNVKVDLSSYVTKTDIKNIPDVDTSSFVLKTILASLKPEVDKLDIDKLGTVPVDLSNLSNVVKHVVKKTVYDKLIAKVNSIDSSTFVLKSKYDTDKSGLEEKIPYTSSLVKKTDYNAKITEIEGKILNISDLATNTALTAVENKIPDVTNPKFNTMLASVVNVRLALANLVTKTDFDDKLSSLNKKSISNENALKKLKTFDLSNF